MSVIGTSAMLLPVGSDGSGIEYPTLDPMTRGQYITLSNGNLTFTGFSGQFGVVSATIGKSSGKWYWEILVDSIGASGFEYAGITNPKSTLGNILRLGSYTASLAYKSNSGSGANYCYRYNFVGSTVLSGTTCLGFSVAAGDIISFSLDMDTTTIIIYKNGVAIGTGVNTLPAGTWYPACQSDGQGGVGTINFGQNAWDARTAALRSSLESSGFTIGFY